MQLRIALGTDDNIHLKQERFGDSIQFRIVVSGDESAVTAELRMNPFSAPELENKPPKILELLYDCNIFIGRSWRAGSFTLFTENGKGVYLSDIEKLDDIIDALVHKNYSRLKIFSLEEQKFIPATKLQ